MPYKLSFGCTPDASGYGYCGKCTAALRAKIWREMSPERKAYDRHFAPGQSREMDSLVADGADDWERGCSCHINPPCGYCTSKADEDEEEEFTEEEEVAFREKIAKMNKANSPPGGNK